MISSKLVCAIESYECLGHTGNNAANPFIILHEAADTLADELKFDQKNAL